MMYEHIGIYGSRSELESYQLFQGLFHAQTVYEIYKAELPEVPAQS